MQILDAHPLLNVRSDNSWDPEVRDRSGGTNLDGDEQVIAGPVARWVARIELGLLGPADRRELKSFLSRLRGRVNALRIRPVCCTPGTLYTRLGGVAPTPAQRRHGIPFSDRALFSDGSGYAVELPPMALAQAAPAFASSLLLDAGFYTRGLAVGDWLGLGGRLHRITGVWPDDPVYRVAVEPPLRLSLAAGAEVDLEPSAIMQLAKHDGGFVGEDRKAPPPVVLSLVEKPGLI